MQEPIQRSHMKMNLHTLSVRGFVLIFVIFVLSFVTMILIGHFVGPNVFVDSPEYTTNLALNWTGSITDLSKLHQQLILGMQVHKDGFESVEVDEKVTLLISIEGGVNKNGSVLWTPISTDMMHTQAIKCPPDLQLCNYIIIAYEPYLSWTAYKYHVSLLNVEGPAAFFISNTTFWFSYINDAFTVFELWCRFIFLAISFSLFLVFIFKLRSYHWRDWSVEQKWVTVLLFGTFAYNNPFFPLTILLSGWFPVFFDIALFASFIVLLLFFWLVMFDGIRQEDTKRSFLKFYLPKIVILGLFWLSLIVGLTLFSLYERDDPTTVVEVQGYITFFQISMLIAIIGYSCWLGYIVCRAIVSMGSMPFLGVRLKFFGIFTLLIFLVTVGGVIFGALSPIRENAATFVAFLSILNFYVYTLAFVYYPSGGLTQEELEQRIGVTRLEEDDEVQLNERPFLDNDLDVTLDKSDDENDN